MAIRTVGLLSPGDMGHTVGGVLHDNGMRVITCLEGRSDRSRTLANEAGIDDVPTMEELVSQADALLCILVPSSALDVAKRVAGAISSTNASILYVDSNAIAPNTVRAAADVILGAGGRFADAGIIGPPPKVPGTRIYTSGPGAAEFSELSAYGLDIHVLDGDIGQASGLKMCYGALTKGLQALSTELLLAARLMGLDDVLRQEQQDTMADVLAWVAKSTPTMPPKAYRWIGEMEEIATCFNDLGLTPSILNGAADMYRLVAGTPIGRETPENRDRSRDLDGVIAALADAMPEPSSTR